MNKSQLDAIQRQYALLAQVVSLAREYALLDEPNPVVIREQAKRVALTAEYLESLAQLTKKAPL